MSLLSLLGVDESVHKTSTEVQAAVSKALVELAPLIHEVENRAGGILHGLLDRFEVDVKISIKPIPKAELAHPPS